MTLAAIVLSSIACAGCGDDQQRVAAARAAAETTPAPVCSVVERDVPFPEEVRETSGLAQSTHDPGVFWTHNDAGGRPEIFAVSATGSLLGRIAVEGAELIDWEAIEAAPCGDERCLFIGDIGDNDHDREHITVYRLIEPGAGESSATAAATLRARYPDGPRDAEALFVDGSGTLHVVNKGDREEIALFRWPAAQSGETATLERVRTLFAEPEDNDDRVTDASTSPDGKWIGIRTYRRLFLYRADELLGDGDAEPIAVDLSDLGEAQGEALVLGSDGEVWLSSEAPNRRTGPRAARLRCALPE